MLQGDLFACGPAGVREDSIRQRTDLGAGAWVDVWRNWFSGTDDLAERLIGTVDWEHHRRWMYDRIVDEPRVSRWYGSDESLPDPALDVYRAAAGDLYGVSFGAMGLNFYREGHDSVAFHADRELRHLDETLVVILTLGAARPFLLRPAEGGRSIDLRPGSGDLLVMGGTCQEQWEHAVPKLSRSVGPRVSASIRWARQGGPEQRWAPPDRSAA